MDCAESLLLSKGASGKATSIQDLSLSAYRAIALDHVLFCLCLVLFSCNPYSQRGISGHLQIEPLTK
jgi:hypothetical protein